MTTIEKYMEDILSFTNSLVIKSTDIAIAINKGLIKQGGLNFISEDKKQWKYFLNLAGEKHYTNNDVKINIIEIGEKRSLSREILQQYTYTRYELLLNGSFYKELINEYPDDEMFIHGCMYPVDKDTAISAPNGTILTYNNKYIEDQEYDLLKELQTYIYNFLSRWNVIEYSIVDELYTPAIYAVLYASIPNKIMNIRNDKILTNQVHSFHLEHFFRSKLSLWDEISIVYKNTVYWLYKNLDNIIKNIGKENTSQLILTKILNTNNIGIGEYLLRLPNNKLNTSENINTPSYTRKEVTGTAMGLNNYYISHGDSYINLDTLINNELKINNNNNNNKNEYIIDNVKNNLQYTYKDKQKTKLLELTTYQLFKRNGLDIVKLIFDHLIYKYKYNSLTFLEEYVEPNTNKTYMCGPYEAILLMIKTFMFITNTDKTVKINKIYYDNVLFPDKDCIDVALKAAFPDGYINTFVNDLKDNYPSISQQCFSVSDFKDLLSNVTKYYDFLWTLDANTESGYTSANFKMLSQLITDKGYLEVSNTEDGEYIDEILIRNNIDFKIENTYDTDLLLQTLFTTFTGVSIDEYKYIREISNGYLTLLNKLTSYTTQIHSADTGENSIYIKYNNTLMMRSLTGIITLKSGDFITLEKPSMFRIHAEASTFNDHPISLPGSNINISASLNKVHPVSINGYIENDETDTYWLSPNIAVETSDYNPYPISKI